VLDVLREFVGVEPDAPELDTVLSTVLFTDIVGSTQKQAEMGATGTKACSSSITRSSETASATGTASSRTPQEMASMQRSTGRHARIDWVRSETPGWDRRTRSCCLVFLPSHRPPAKWRNSAYRAGAAQNAIRVETWTERRLPGVGPIAVRQPANGNAPAG
jgi:hypothetical protein